MDIKYRTIYQYGKDEIIINKSKFIGHAKAVEDEKEALDFIHSISSKYYDATHNVYAYVLGENNNIQRFNDDGEPSGTAGIPVLEVIKKENLKNVAVVVTRYFGGIKLGAGGLIRAYTKGAKIGLEAGIIIDKILHKKIKVRINYNLYGIMENFLKQNGYIVDNIIYDDAVNIFVYISVANTESFLKKINDLTNGTATMEILNEEYIAMKDGKRL